VDTVAVDIVAVDSSKVDAMMSLEVSVVVLMDDPRRVEK